MSAYLLALLRVHRMPWGLVMDTALMDTAVLDTAVMDTAVMDTAVMDTAVQHGSWSCVIDI